MRARGALLGAALILSVAVAGAQGGHDLFQQALMKERAEDNLPEAIRLYERIVKEFASNRPLVARTLVQLGAAYEKRRDMGLARAAYSRVDRDFTTEAEAVAEARRRLAALHGAPAAGGVTLRVAATGDDADSGAWITPDGRYMARPHWETGDLAVRDMVLGTTTRMMVKTDTWASGREPDAYVQEAMLAPDQTAIAYVWFASSGDVGNVSRYQLRVVPNRAGSKPRVLVDSAEYEYFRLAGWSPDGRSILASLQKPDSTSLLAWIAVDGSRGIRPLRALGWRLGRSRPNLSLDGRYVAYSALPTDPGKPVNYLEEPAQQHLYVLPTDGSGTEAAVARGASINESPVWTPDGRRILFISNRSGTGFGLWSVGVQDGRMTESPSVVNGSVTGRVRPLGITRQGGFFFTPASDGGPGADIFLARVDATAGEPAGRPLLLLDNFPNRNLAPAWSPDGKKIAFFRQRTGSASPIIDRDALTLVVYDRDNETEREFPMSYLEAAMPPQWFRDGKSVLVYSHYDGGNLYKVDLESGSRRSVQAIAHSRLPERMTSAVLSPDEETLYLGVRGASGASAPWEILAFDLATGERGLVWAADGVASNTGVQFALSPDGRRLAVALRRTDWPSARVIAMNLDGGNSSELAQSVIPGTVAWTRNGIYFSTDEDQSRLMRIPPTGGKPEPTRIPGGTHPVSLSPDGTSILLTQSTRDEDRLYMIENLTSLWASAASK